MEGVMRCAGLRHRRGPVYAAIPAVTAMAGELGGVGLISKKTRGREGRGQGRKERKKLVKKVRQLTRFPNRLSAKDSSSPTRSPRNHIT